jgi:SAM-dependent methyltransferase
MAKQGEIDYLRLAGDEHAVHAFNKPFSDERCGQLFLDLGIMLSLLPQPPARVLDLGVGTGWTSTLLGKRGYDVVGQDIANDMIDLAELNKKRYEVETLRFIVSDYENMGFKGEFDAAVFYDCLHHAVDEVAALKAVYDALKPGGICLTFEPGVGHSQSPESIRAMELYGVTERDMPPELIVEGALKVGFSGFELYERITHPKKLLPLPGVAKPVGVFSRGSPLRMAIKKLDVFQAIRSKRAGSIDRFPPPLTPMESSHIVLLRK